MPPQDAVDAFCQNNFLVGSRFGARRSGFSWFHSSVVALALAIDLARFWLVVKKGAAANATRAGGIYRGGRKGFGTDQRRATPGTSQRTRTFSPSSDLLVSKAGALALIGPGPCR